MKNIACELIFMYIKYSYQLYGEVQTFFIVNRCQILYNIVYTEDSKYKRLLSSY